MNIIVIVWEDLCCEISLPVEDYAKDGGSGEVGLLCSFYHEPFAHLN